MRRSLYIELLRQQMLTALIPIVMIGGIASIFIFPQLSANIKAQHEILALSVSDQVSAHLQTTKEQLKLIGMDISKRENDPRLSDSLDKYTAATQTFETIYITDADNKIKHIGLPASKTETRRLFIDMDVSFSSLWQTQDQAAFSWSNIFISPISGLQSVALQMPMGSSKLLAEIDILQMPSLAKSLSRGEIKVMILDEKATLIAHPDADISQQQLNLGYSPLFINQTDEIRSGTFQWDGTQFHATVVPLPETHWQVVVSEPNRSFFAIIHYLIMVWVTLATVTLIVSAYVALLSAKRQSQPFIELTQMAKKISGGDYAVRSIPTIIEEIEGVSESFVLMANRVKKREDELTKLNTELEGRVEERTSELVSINEELSQSLTSLETTMEQLVQAEKLASLGSLVAGVAHELNTPIGNAKIAASSQQDYLRDFRRAMEGGDLTKTILVQFINDIDTTADMGLRNMERASELIRSFKQVAVDQTSSHQRKFSLATLVNEVLVTLRPTLKKLPVEVETHIPTSIEMNSMPGPLSQVLTNLINNAVFHGLAEKPHMIISINAEENEGVVHMVVSDTGIGIPEEHIKRAYDPFFTTKMGQGGSGLGLNIVHRVITGMLFGQIELTSVVDEGTTFNIHLPVDINQVRDQLESETPLPMA